VEAEAVEAEALGVKAEAVDELAASTSLVNGNGLLFHMTQPISRSTTKAIACSKPTICEN